MIFVTVGSVLPFDRLVRAVDDWAGSRARVDVFAQIGQTSYRPRNIDWQSHLHPSDFRDRFEAADLVVGHAGMGTILTALELKKPLLVMPRRAALKEHTTDHQVATARRFSADRGVAVAYEAADLHERLDHAEEIGVGLGADSSTAQRLVEEIQHFVKS